MIIYTAADLTLEDRVTEENKIASEPNVEYFTDEAYSSDDASIGHFCDFVDFYTRHTSNPMCTALTCEKQAEAIRITQGDLSPETIKLLLDTMLTAIDHLEKKWLDEQIQREEQVRYQSNPAQIAAPLRERQSGRSGIMRLWQSGRFWLRKWFTSRDESANRKHRKHRRPLAKGAIAQSEVPV